MTETGHPDQDALVALALGTPDEASREAITTHLGACLTCRRKYQEYADAVEQVLPATARVAPPADFAVRVLDRIGAEGSATQRPGGSEDSASHAGGPRREAASEPSSIRSPAGRRSRRRWPAVAAAAVLGIGLGAVVGIWWAQEETPGGAATAQEWRAPLQTAEGEQVGQVTRSRGPDGKVLVMQVSGGPVGAWYTCRVVRQDGSTEEVGYWELRSDSANSWVITDTSGVIEVQLVSDTGHVWASALL